MQSPSTLTLKQTSGSPVHLSPTVAQSQVTSEVWERIFSLVCFSEEYAPSNLSIRNRKSLSAVCHQWRLVIIGTPSFWTRIVLYLTEEGKVDLEHTKTWLSRSATDPLFVDLRWDNTANVMTQEATLALGAIIEQSYRWQYLGTPHALLNFEIFSRIAGRTPNLQLLQLQIPFTRRNCMNIFFDSPRLRSLRTSAVPDDIFVLPLSQIEHLSSSSATETEMLSCVHYMPALKTCVIRPKSFDRYVKKLEKVVMTAKSLESLTILDHKERDWTAQINTPSLRSLTFEGAITTPWTVNGFAGFIVPSYTNLRQLRLLNNNTADSAVVSCLEALPSLAELEIENRNCLTANLLERLTHSQEKGDVANTNLLPQLEVLVLSSHHKTEHGSKLFGMIDSRRAKPNPTSGSLSHTGKLGRVQLTYFLEEAKDFPKNVKQHFGEICVKETTIREEYVVRTFDGDKCDEGVNVFVKTRIDILLLKPLEK